MNRAVVAAELRYLSPEEGFLGIDAEAPAAANEARAVVIPFGLEASVSYGRGTHAGPQAILAASRQVELFDEELWCEAHERYGVVTLQPPEIAADMSSALDQLECLVASVLESNRFPLTLGGEHAITPGAIRPFARRFDDLVILQVDAHADLRDGYAGEHFSHAAAMRRCLDFPGVELIGVGIRNISRDEVPFLEANRHRIHLHWARDRAQWDLDEVLAPLNGRPVYVTFDVDGLDVSLMPATGTPEPGGLFWDDVMPLLWSASRKGTIVGADITELAPRAELHGCDFLAAKLAYKILNYALA